MTNERGQWEVIPRWGIRNVFNRAAIEIRPVNMSEEEKSAFIVRIRQLLNADVPSPAADRQEGQ